MRTYRTLDHPAAELKGRNELFIVLKLSQTLSRPFARVPREHPPRFMQMLKESTAHICFIIGVSLCLETWLVHSRCPIKCVP